MNALMLTRITKSLILKVSVVFLVGSLLAACSNGNNKVVEDNLQDEEPFPPVVKKTELHPAEQAAIEFMEAAYIHQDVERVAKVIKVKEEEPSPDQDGFFEEVRGMGKPESYIDGYRPLKARSSWYYRR